MRKQAIYNLLLVFGIFIYQYKGGYMENVTIQLYNDVITTDYKNDVLYFNGDPALIKEVIRQPTRKSKIWAVFFYSVFSFYIALTNITLHKKAIVKIYRSIFFYSFLFLHFLG